MLGMTAYLKIFSWYKIKTLKNDKGENDFFFFLNLIPANSDVLDIGANIGIMAYYLSKKAAQNKVIAFEPMPQNLQTLHWVKSKFNLKNLTILNLALGNQNGEIEMVLPVVDKVKKQGLSHVLTDEIKEFNEGETFKAKMCKLDDIQELVKLNIKAIKIDVENFEYQVFRGAESILKQHKPIIYCELWDNKNRYDCFDYLTSLGYKIMVKQDNDIVEFDAKNHTTQNFFFVHYSANFVA